MMGAESELDLHFYPGARRCSAPAQRFSITPGRGHAVHSPGYGLENGRLAGSVWTNNPGESGTEFDLGALVLPEILQSNPIDLHQPPARSRSTMSMSSCPNRTNAARSSSAGSGLPER